MKVRVPPLNKSVRSFCSSISESQPVFLRIQPDPEGAYLNCFLIVERKVRESGGSTVLGWQIWERPGIFIEAEFHAVWRDPNGNLVDVTPKPFGFREILFLEDSKRQYDGVQVNNIRQALRPYPAISQWLHWIDQRFEFLNRGEKALQHGELTLTPDEKAEHTEILRQIAVAQAAVDKLESIGWKSSSKKRRRK